jgi:hypothetical protein
MTNTRKYRFTSLCLLVGLTLACESQEFREGPVDFDSEGAQTVRHRVCAQDWESAARKGSAAETYNATTIWSVSPYQIMLPGTGAGFFKVNVDAPHYDWLLYTTSDVELSSLEAAALEYNGPVKECPEQGLIEYGVHHTGLMDWPLRVDGNEFSRVRFYAGLAATDHSDPDAAGHAGHDLSGDENAPNHGGH